MRLASAKKRFFNAVIDFLIFPLSVSLPLGYFLTMGFLPYISHLVSPPGLEPGTHSLKGCRSNRLSYGPIFFA